MPGSVARFEDGNGLTGAENGRGMREDRSFAALFRGESACLARGGGGPADRFDSKRHAQRDAFGLGFAESLKSSRAKEDMGELRAPCGGVLRWFVYDLP